MALTAQVIYTPSRTIRPPRSELLIQFLQARIKLTFFKVIRIGSESMLCNNCFMLPPTPKTLHPRYNLRLSLNHPFRFHCLPPIYADTPPWLLPTPQLDLRLTKLLKSQTPPSHFRALFNEIVNSYPNRILCFTDGSKRGNRVGCAYSINNRVQNFRPRNTSTVFTAELQASITA